MKIEISSTSAVRHFGDCLARIRHGGDTYVITKNRKPVAELRPVPAERSGGVVADLFRIWKPDPSDAGFADDLSAANSRELPVQREWD